MTEPKYITPAHRAKAFCVIRDIANHCMGSDYAPGESYQNFYSDTIKPMYNRAMDADFSLKAGVCTYDEYDMFMEFVLELGLTLGVQFKRSPQDCFCNTDRYLILMIKLRKCCLTGQSDADIHHSMAIGAGVDRTEVDHSKYPRIALCREKHIECHQMGNEAFEAKYHVYGTYCDYHNEDYENSIEIIIESSDIKKWKYHHIKELLGVRYKSGMLTYYRMSNKEHDAMMMSANAVEWFYSNVHNVFEQVQL